MDDADLLVEQLPCRRRTLRIAIVTETYAPDANDVALDAVRLVEGLRRREHEIELVRPRRPMLKVGLPAKRALASQWSRSRPDVVHVLTQGPLAWSALSAARQLRLPVVSDFQAHFVDARHGVGWLSKPILVYLRKFHNRVLWTFVPTEALCAQLTGLGFRNLRVVARQRMDPTLKQLETLLEIAAGIGAAYHAAGERRARACVPQGT